MWGSFCSSFILAFALKLQASPGVSSPSKQSNSPLLFSKCGLLPLSTACQGCCGGRKEGEGFPLCVTECVCLPGIENQEDICRIWLYLCTSSSLHILHLCVYMCICVCVFEVGGGVCVTEAGKMLVRSVAVVIGRS